MGKIKCDDLKATSLTADDLKQVKGGKLYPKVEIDVISWVHRPTPSRGKVYPKIDGIEPRA